MQKLNVGFAALAAVLFLSAPISAQQMFVYPTKGQSAERQNRDQSECQGWAIQQSGFNPANPRTYAAAPPPTNQAPQGGLLRGAARGAAAGAIGGAIAGDAGKGAAIGAATGAFIGGLRRRDQRRQQRYQQQQYQQQQQAQLAQGQDLYVRAFSACMQGRGYTVK